MRYFLISIITGLLWQPLFSQEHIVKEYGEANKKMAYCFYASTLRMVNISENEAYNDLVSGVNKLLIYVLDSAAIADKSYTGIIDDYKEEGFEEYASVWGNTNLFLYGKEGRNNQMVGVFGNRENAAAFYLNGSIAWQKIPELFNTLQQNDIINVFELNISDFHD